MDAIRTIFRVIGAVWLIAVIVIGIGGTYLSRNPEAAGAYALGAMSVDREAGAVDQVRQAANGYARAREGIEAMREIERESGARASLADKRRKYEDLREAGWGHEAAAKSAGLPVVRDGIR